MPPVGTLPLFQCLLLPGTVLWRLHLLASISGWEYLEGRRAGGAKTGILLVGRRVGSEFGVTAESGSTLQPTNNVIQVPERASSQTRHADHGYGPILSLFNCA